MADPANPRGHQGNEVPGTAHTAFHIPHSAPGSTHHQHIRKMMTDSYTLAVHGGAGTIAPGITPENEAPYHGGLHGAVLAGERILAAGGTALDAVIASVCVLEDCPLFNAGRGSVYTSDATQEMDAIVMDGLTQAAGAVAGVRTVRNPVELARAVMERSPCVLLAGEGAERFARECGIALVDPAYFATAERLQQLRRVQALSGGPLLDHDSATRASAPIAEDRKMGTVGAVARDKHGNLASAVSTGGMTNKRPGRIGDTPLVGAGCYASNAEVAVAATGTGEHFIRAVASYDIAARMRYAGQSLEQAAGSVVFERLPAIGGQGGVIAVDRDGNLSMPFNTTGMYRGWVQFREGAGDGIRTAIFR
jgi:L-asparaginase / beta-aspartyl-peptidase